MNSTSSPYWMRLLLAAIVAQKALINALPNPEAANKLHLEAATLSAPVSVGELVTSDSVATTELALRDTDGEAIDDAVNDASALDEADLQDAKKPAKHHPGTGKQHPVKGKPPVKGKHPVKGNPPVKGKHPVKGKPPVKGKNGHLHYETHATAADAAKGGKIIKSSKLTVGKAKPVKPRASKKTNDYDTESVCDTHIVTEEVDFVGTMYANLVSGYLHDVSDALCPPGSIGHSYSFTTSWSVSAQVGPDLKDLIPKSNPLGKNLDKFGMRFGVQYAWSDSQTTTYTAAETSGQNHPFVVTYRPRIMVVEGNIQKTSSVMIAGERFICEVQHPGKIALHVPIHTNDDCASQKTACGPSVTWDHCFFVGDFAKVTCPDRPLGPMPAKGRLCPTSFYPQQYINGGHIAG